MRGKQKEGRKLCHYAIVVFSALLITPSPSIPVLPGASALAAGSGFGSSPSRKTKKKKAKAGSKTTKPPAYRMDESSNIASLWDHLIEVEECEGLEDMRVGWDDASSLRGVYAQRDFHKGEYICAIPFVSTLLIDETFYPDMKDETDAQELQKRELQLSADRLSNGKAFMEKFVMPDRKGNSNLLISNYITCLPQPSAEDASFSPTPDFWSTEEIQQLKIPGLVQDFLTRKEEIHQFVGKEETNDTKDRLTAEELQYAMWIVRSRGFTTLKQAVTLDGTEGWLQRTVLIPALDFLNHEAPSTANAQLEIVETHAYEESFYALVASRPIARNEALTICYGTGDETPWEIYAKYGFWPDNDRNPTKKASKRMHELLQSLQPEFTTTLEDDRAKLLTATDTLSKTQQEILRIRMRAKELLKDYA